MGDLVHVPTGSYRILYTREEDDGQMHIPFTFSITQEPKVGVFKNYFGSSECVILFNDGEYCVDTRWVFKKQGVKENDRTYYNFSNKSKLVSQ
tara:strand:+ start:644 stop:922 length:279 start_codon:yes stop_codon:yes gene_type:complete